MVSRARGSSLLSRKPPLCQGVLASIIFGLGLKATFAQEALRSSISGEEMAAARRLALENPNGNIQLGPVNLLVGGALGIEFNNNINYSDTDRQKDIIF